MTTADELLRAWAANPGDNLGPVLADAIKEQYPNVPAVLLTRLRTQNLSLWARGASVRMGLARLTVWDLYATVVYLGQYERPDLSC